VSYDPGRWFVMGEVVHMDSNQQAVKQVAGNDRAIAYVDRSAVD
jgi:hypothetical protein